MVSQEMVWTQDSDSSGRHGSGYRVLKEPNADTASGGPSVGLEPDASLVSSSSELGSSPPEP